MVYTAVWQTLTDTECVYNDDLLMLPHQSVLVSTQHSLNINEAEYISKRVHILF